MFNQFDTFEKEKHFNVRRNRQNFLQDHRDEIHHFQDVFNDTVEDEKINNACLRQIMIRTKRIKSYFIMCARVYTHNSRPFTVYLKKSLFSQNKPNVFYRSR